MTYFTKSELLDSPIRRAAYSDRSAWLMAKMSQLAYERFEDDGGSVLERDLATGGFRLVKTFVDVSTDTQAFIAINDRLAVLAFRGTEGPNLKDIFTDLDARWQRTARGKLHQGFFDAYRSVEDDIVAAVEGLPRDVPLYVCGHSLGGALAVVATHRLENRHHIAACYTFGAPRVGGPKWTDKLKSPVYRTVNATDGVPLVPPSFLLAPFLMSFKNVGFIGFQHPGFLTYLPHAKQGSDGVWPYNKYKNGTAGVLSRFNRLLIGIPLGLASFNFKILGALGRDHRISAYVGKLEAIALEHNETMASPAPASEPPQPVKALWPRAVTSTGG